MSGRSIQASTAKEKSYLNKNSTERFISNHECSGIDCHASETTSSNSDIEERTRTKATKFFKAYPKYSNAEKRFSSSESCVSDLFKGNQTNIGTSSSDPEEEKEDNKRVTVDTFPSYHIVQGKNSNSKPMSLKFVSYTQPDKHTNQNSQKKFQTKRFNKIELQLSSDSSVSDSEEPLLKPTTTTKNHLVPASCSSKCKANAATTKVIKSKATSVKLCQTDSSAKVKPSRSFHAYPLDPQDATHDFDTAKMKINAKPENYDGSRKGMLGNRNSGNTNTRRTANVDFCQEKKYRNNIATGRSRIVKSEKEDELTVRCAYLEQENMFLKKKVGELERERAKLKSQWKMLAKT